MERAFLNQINLPNLFVPGAGKSGTSTLHALLDQHPRISMSLVKEPKFWIKEDFDSFSDTEFKSYASLFNFSDSKSYFGESSTLYMCFPEFIERIKSYKLNDSKFIFILRNPIDRCYSHYWWLKGMGSERNNLKDAFLYDLDIEPSNKTRLDVRNFKQYYQFGLYGKWLTKFYNNFGAQNIHFITFEALKKDTLKTVNSCFDFLELERLDSLEEIKLNATEIVENSKALYWAKKFAFRQYNLPVWLRTLIPRKLSKSIRSFPKKMIYKYSKKSTEYPKISLDDRAFLKDYYIEDIKVLKSLVSYDFPEWLDFKDIV